LNLKGHVVTIEKLTVALTMLLTSLASLAAGNHGGGHGDALAIGVAGQPSKVNRIITVDMTDAMRFAPASISVKQGETIRFVVQNSGKIKHEMVLGSLKELQEHSELMKKHPDMEHADDNQITVLPGQKGEIIWQFTRAGKVNFACLQPGHYDAGMKGVVKVKRPKSL
jgi:uncharacterized cupredoxin-like copper-binding protein